MNGTESMRSSACVYKRKLFATPTRGTLTLSGGRLQFVSKTNEVVFDIATPEALVCFERISQGMDLLSNGHHWWVAFCPPPELFMNTQERIHQGQKGQLSEAIEADRLFRAWRKAAQEEQGLRVVAKSEWKQVKVRQEASI